MIEVQIRDEEVYQKVRQYASYKSDLTHVCAFRDELAPLLFDMGVDVPRSEAERVVREADKPYLTITSGKVPTVRNAPAEMLHFLGVRSEFDPTVPMHAIHQLHQVLKWGMIKPDKEFHSVYAKMGYRNHISELIAANVRIPGKGKLVDLVDGDLTVQTLGFGQVEPKVSSFKNFLLKVRMHHSTLNDPNPLAVVELDRYWEAEAYECGRDGRADMNRIVTLRFYNRPIVLKSILFDGNRINVAAQKVTEIREGVLAVANPVILPAGAKMLQDVWYTPPNRKIPADMWRAAMDEFLLRYDQEWRKD